MHERKAADPLLTGLLLLMRFYSVRRKNYSAVIAPVGQAPSQAPQSMQASAFTTATPPSTVTAPTGQAPSQAPQPTHASETLCAIIKLSFYHPCTSFKKKSALARCQQASPEFILVCILTKWAGKGKTNRKAEKPVFLFLLGCTKAKANFLGKLREFFGENHEEWLVL